MAAWQVAFDSESGCVMQGDDEAGEQGGGFLHRNFSMARRGHAPKQHQHQVSQDMHFQKADTEMASSCCPAAGTCPSSSLYGLASPAATRHSQLLFHSQG